MDGQTHWSVTMVHVTQQETFTNLMKVYAVNHITSSPHYPQSNGLEEKFVQIVKNLFCKAKEEGVDVNKYLMIYRNTPLTCTSKSPMQMLQQRSSRSQLPMSNAARRKLGILLNNHHRKTSIYHHSTSILDKMSCVRVQLPRNGFL